MQRGPSPGPPVLRPAERSPEPRRPFQSAPPNRPRDRRSSDRQNGPQEPAYHSCPHRQIAIPPCYWGRASAHPVGSLLQRHQVPEQIRHLLLAKPVDQPLRHQRALRHRVLLHLVLRNRPGIRTDLLQHQRARRASVRGTAVFHFAKCEVSRPTSPSHGHPGFGHPNIQIVHQTEHNLHLQMQLQRFHAVQEQRIDVAISR